MYQRYWMSWSTWCIFDLIPAIVETKDATFTQSRVNFIQLVVCTLILFLLPFLGNVELLFAITIVYEAVFIAWTKPEQVWFHSNCPVAIFWHTFGSWTVCQDHIFKQTRVRFNGVHLTSENQFNQTLESKPKALVWKHPNNLASPLGFSHLQTLNHLNYHKATRL